MAAKPKSRNKPIFGAPRKFKTPEALATACDKYFAEVDKWRDHKNVAKVVKGEVQIVKLERSVPYCIERLTDFIGIVPSTWYGWKNKNSSTYRPDLLEVIEQVDNKINAQHFEGASTGTFNSVIMSRKLGLADRQIVEGQMNTRVENVSAHAESFAADILRSHGLEPIGQDTKEKTDDETSDA